MNGAVDGICVVSSNMSCVRDADPTTVVTTNVAWNNTECIYSCSVEAEAGTRTFWPSNNTTGLGCFDWSTMALCTGPAFSADGFSHNDIGGNGLYRTYGTVWDGSCAVALGDPGRIYTMDINGNSPCTSLDSGAAPLKIDLRRQRYDQKVGNATWDQVRVFDTDLTAGTNFTSFLVTISDAATGLAVASKEMVGTDGVLDLSGIDPVQHRSLTVRAISRSVDGGKAWADGHAPKVQLLWNADAAPLGFQTTSDIACPTGENPTLAVTSKAGNQTAQGVLPLAPPPSCTTTTTTTTIPTGTTTTLPTTSTTTSTTLPTSTTTSTTLASGTTTSTTLPTSTTTSTTLLTGSTTTTSTTLPTGSTSTTLASGTTTSTIAPPGPTSSLPPGGAVSGVQVRAGGQPPAPSAGTLARTGTNSGLLALLGGLALCLGGILVAATRRRRMVG
jgi:hypothetical protein